jgi:hypothetical protein
MVIDIPQDAVETLSVRAHRAGFDSVESYVAAHVVEFASNDSCDDEEFARLSESELRASVAMLDQSMADLAAGKDEDFRKVLAEIVDEFGLNLNR